MPFIATIVVPIYNEATCIEQCLAQLRCYRNRGFEILLVDGGSSDQTLEVIQRHADDIDGFITVSQGRAEQMNAGAARAQAPWIVFLHVDTVLPENVQDVIDALAKMRSRNQAWGFFAVSLSGESIWFRLIEWAMNWRSRLTRIATGDQALCVDRESFQTMQGFTAIPLMEDIDFCRRARKSMSSYRIPFPVITSSRRWEQKGIVRTVILMWILRFQFWLGVPAEKLAIRYRK